MHKFDPRQVTPHPFQATRFGAQHQLVETIPLPIAALYASPQATPATTPEKQVVTQPTRGLGLTVTCRIAHRNVTRSANPKSGITQLSEGGDRTLSPMTAPRSQRPKNAHDMPMIRVTCTAHLH